MEKVVVDTNVLVAGLRSRLGASFALLERIGTGLFEHVLTVPLVMEYEDVLLRPGMVPLSSSAVQDVIDFLCSAGAAHDVHFLWRPVLPDARDDMVLEAAVNGGCRWIVTFNTRDFAAGSSLGVEAIRPGPFLQFLEKSA